MVSYTITQKYYTIAGTNQFYEQKTGGFKETTESK